MSRALRAPATSVDVEGPTIPQAIAKGLALLRVTRDQVRVTVHSEGEPGLFGMRGHKLAKVRVTLVKRRA